MATDVDAVLEAVTVRPGDTLLIRVSPDLSLDALDELVGHMKQLKDKTGAADVVLIGCEQIACIRSAGGED